MESSHRLLLVAGLLAAVLPAVAAVFGPQLGAPCEPTLLATQIALSCVLDMPTAHCCEPVVAAVDLGGGVPCLCRVAAEPQLVMAGLNASHLLTIYITCGGLRPGVAHLAAACEGPAPPATVVSSPPSRRPSPAPRRKKAAHDAPPPPMLSRNAYLSFQQHHRAFLANNTGYDVCAHAKNLANDIGTECGLYPSSESCCSILKFTIPSSDALVCLCALAENIGVKETGLEIGDVIKFYAHCMGLRPEDFRLPAAGCSQGP
ncbi:hypothetical protein VPH35_071235 [Triticum aestivum]